MTSARRQKVMKAKKKPKSDFSDFGAGGENCLGSVGGLVAETDPTR